MKYIELVNSALDGLSVEEKNLCNAYLKFINNKIDEQFKESGFREKLAEAIAKGLPYYIDEDLNIKTLAEEEFFKTTQQGNI